MKKVILLAVVLLSASLVYGAKLFVPASVQSITYTYPDDFPGAPENVTLDQAIHSANDTDTIIVRSGTYYEHLNVTKSITLEGHFGVGPTILDGEGNGTVVTISATNVTLRSFTIRNGNDGIVVASAGNTLENNTVVSNEDDGIYIMSGSNTLRNNNMTGNGYNFGVSDVWQDVDSSNTVVDGKPIYYWVNRTGGTIPSDAGYVALVNSMNVAVKNLNLVRNRQGMLLAYTNNSAIENNSLLNNYDGIDLIASEYDEVMNNKVLSNNYGGIRLDVSQHNEIMNNNLTNNGAGLYLYKSDNNTIVYNDIEKNLVGVGLWKSNNNTLYRNNFLGNDNPLFTTNSSNSFNNSREGNYWSNYFNYGGRDLDGDGIGDTVTPYYGVDHHPLMEPWKMTRTFGVTRYGDSIHYRFTTLSNSTIASPNWNRTRALIGFNVTSGTHESINITIPRNWLEGPFEIRLNASQVEPSTPVNQDGTNSYICLAYNPGTYMVEIIGKKVLGYSNGDTDNNGIVDIYDAIRLAGSFNQSDQ